MSCQWCVLGNDCRGPNDVDDLGANCHCECHLCDDCDEIHGTGECDGPEPEEP